MTKFGLTRKTVISKYYQGFFNENRNVEYNQIQWRVLIQTLIFLGKIDIETFDQSFPKFMVNKIKV